VSLVDGWIPVVVQLAAVLLLLAGLLRKSRGWLTRWIPVLSACGVGAAWTLRWYFASLGIASEPAPWSLWVWAGTTVAAGIMVVGSWAAAGWLRRNMYVFTASLCLLSVGLTVNTWIGYFPTIETAFAQLTAKPLPGEVDWPTLTTMQQRSSAPASGSLVPIDTGTHASGLQHRREYAYLPPAWFVDPDVSRMPAIMMIGGEFNTPADWVRLGRAARTLDAVAASHHGYAPVAVFVDSNGSFGNDTECVNGPRGNAADHLTEEVIPAVAAQLRVRATGWGVVGFSAGGTCAVDLAAMRPDLFAVFVDIAGDLGPNAGTKDQTIQRLYGGDAEAWATFDPSTVLRTHERYRHLSGRFVVPAADAAHADGYGRAARTLCRLGTTKGIDCTVVEHPGRHTWPFAADAFAQSLPWLANELSESQPANG
jgi:S-formylglutathione hydrolase FrmB